MPLKKTHDQTLQWYIDRVKQCKDYQSSQRVIHIAEHNLNLTNADIESLNEISSQKPHKTRQTKYGSILGRPIKAFKVGSPTYT